jgi:ketosteroid isomerase-like protein
VSANLDLVRSIYADWERGDFSSVGWADPDIEYVVADGPDPGSWTGLAAMADVIRDQLKAWEDLRFTADEYRELAAERVLVLGHARGRGKRSGLELGQLRGERTHVFRVRNGKVTRLVSYRDRNRALADLGLEA